MKFTSREHEIAFYVENVETQDFDDIFEVNVLKVSFDDKEKPPVEVIHYYFKAWQDHGVPAIPHMLRFLDEVRNGTSLSPKVQSILNNKDLDGPMLVHCSAGVGRTGTFIVLYDSIEKLLIFKANDINCDATMLQLRLDRNMMVQTASQYWFIYQCLTQYLVNNKLIVDINGPSEYKTIKNICRSRYSRASSPNSSKPATNNSQQTNTVARTQARPPNARRE